MARKPIGTMALRCAQWTGFHTFPIEKYNGWYLMSPVLTVTVVLSLPRMMVTNMCHCYRLDFLYKLHPSREYVNFLYNTKSRKHTHWCQAKSADMKSEHWRPPFLSSSTYGATSNSLWKSRFASMLWTTTSGSQYQMSYSCFFQFGAALSTMSREVLKHFQGASPKFLVQFH